MKAELKTLSNDLCDLENYVPEESDSFMMSLTLTIGPTNDEGSNYFYVRVCTPEWLCKHQWLPELMRHTLLVRRYDLVEIKQSINDYIDRCEDDNWVLIAQKLSRVFAWEYEDYQP